MSALIRQALQGKLAKQTIVVASGGRDTEQLLAELSPLTTFQLNAEKAIGELYGSHQSYKLEEL